MSEFIASTALVVGDLIGYVVFIALLPFLGIYVSARYYYGLIACVLLFLFARWAQRRFGVERSRRWGAISNIVGSIIFGGLVVYITAVNVDLSTCKVFCATTVELVYLFMSVLVGSILWGMLGLKLGIRGKGESSEQAKN